MFHLICSFCYSNSLAGNLETYLRVSSKLKLGTFGDDFSVKLNSSSPKSRQSVNETDAATGAVKTGKIQTLTIWTYL